MLPHAESFVGMLRAAAIQRATEDETISAVRVARVDQDYSVLTRDLKMNRINFQIDHGIVTKAHYG